MSLTTKIVDDIDMLKAIAHPLRMKMLGSLRADGPATASELGRRFGESSGSTSYHLRQLERFGFIEEDATQPSARERRWVASHQMTSFPTKLADSEGGRSLFEVVRRQQLELLQEGLATLTEVRRGFGHSDYVVQLDPDDLESLGEDIEAVIDRYRGRGGSQSAVIHVLALPRSRS